MSGNQCDMCNNLVYDEDEEDYICEVDMDEDDMARLYSGHSPACPYFQSNDEYEVVKHQAF